MKAPAPCFRVPSRQGFTLVEVLLAVLIFSLAVVALVEAVNDTARTALVGRQERQVQARMDTLLLEATREPNFLTKVGQGQNQESKVTEGNVTYTTQIQRLDLDNEDGQALPDLFEVSVTARWKEGRDEQDVKAATWVFPPLFMQKQGMQ